LPSPAFLPLKSVNPPLFPLVFLPDLLSPVQSISELAVTCRVFLGLIILRCRKFMDFCYLLEAFFSVFPIASLEPPLFSPKFFSNLQDTPPSGYRRNSSDSLASDLMTPLTVRSVFRRAVSPRFEVCGRRSFCLSFLMTN